MMLTPKQRFIQSRRPSEEQEEIKNIPKQIKKVPSDFVGPLQPGYVREKESENIEGQEREIFRDTIQTERLAAIGVQVPKAPSKYKFKAAKKYGLLEDIPISEYKYYEGGSEYLQSLTPREKKKAVEEYMETGEWRSYQKSPRGREQFKLKKSAIAHEGLGPLDLVVVETVPSQKVWENLAYNNLFTEFQDADKKLWESLDVQTRYTRIIQENFVSGVLAIPTLIEQTVNFILNTGTPLTKWQEEHMVSYTPSLVKTGVSEVLTGGKSDAFERITSSPERFGESILATGSEFWGFYGGGQLVHVGKVGTIRGFGRIRSGIMKRIGWELPSYSTFVKYSPVNLFRTGVLKIKTRLGLKGFIPEESVWDRSVLEGYKRFAEQPGAAAQLKLFRSMRELETGDILGIHASGTRFGKLLRIGVGRESPGMSVSVFGRGSPNFLRITGENLSYGTSGVSLFPKFHLPTAPIFRLKNMFRLPRSLRGASYKETGKYILSKPSGPYGWIAPKVELGGAEIEAIIRKGWGIRTGNYYWTTYKGVAVPLPEYGIFGKIPTGLGSNVGRVVSDGVKNFFSFSYVSTPSISLTPGILSSGFRSYKSSNKISSFLSLPSFRSGYKSRLFSSSNIVSKSFSISTSKSYSKSGITSSLFSSKSSNLGSISPSVSKYVSLFKIAPSSKKYKYVSEDYRKRRIKGFRDLDLFGKGWRKRKWFDLKMDVI